MSTISFMTFFRHTTFLPAFREELDEFDFAVDTLEHSDKSDSGLNSSCLDDRLSSSYSESKLSSSFITSPSPHFSKCETNLRVRFTLSRRESVRDYIIIIYALGFPSILLDVARLKRDCSSTFDSASRHSRIARLSLSRYPTMARRWIQTSSAKCLN